MAIPCLLFPARSYGKTGQRATSWTSGRHR